MVTLPSFVDQLVRLTTAFNRILRLSGATVQSAAFTEQGLVIAPSARHTTDFENVTAWLAQRMDKASIARLLRCSWEAVDAIVTRSWSTTSTTPDSTGGVTLDLPNPRKPE